MDSVNEEYTHYKDYPESYPVLLRGLSYTGMVMFYLVTVVGLGVILFFMDPLAALTYTVVGSVLEGLAAGAYLRGERKSNGSEAPAGGR